MAGFANFRLLALAAIAVGMAGCALPGKSPWEKAGGSTEELRIEKAAEPKPGLTVRGQSPGFGQPSGGYPSYPSATTPDGYSRGPQAVSGGPPPTAGGGALAPYSVPTSQPTYTYQPPAGNFPGPGLPPPPSEGLPPLPGASPFTPAYPGLQLPSNVPPEAVATPTPLDVFVEETRTGQFMFGVAVNSNNGVTGNIVLSERNFDITRFPTSWDDFLNGTAWRGAGQGFRIEAQPGNQYQRYLVSFTDPYFLNSNISFNASAFYFNRAYFDWTEGRVGGRLSWGYRLTPDLSVTGALRAEDVDVYNPRVTGVAPLDAVLGHNDIYSGRVTLTRDTRDLPFMPTEGQLLELAYEQVFGTFSYPRGEINLSQYFMIRQRPDGSGRHTIALSTKTGFSGSDTPIFENYFAGGFSTLRGFAFRGASPLDQGVRVGGQFQFINSVEYFFPLTADDMIRGTVFCDFGTVEQNIALHGDNFRVAPGVGLRINVPALGPAPLAFDFAFPIASAPNDQKQTFSFFFGAMR